MRLITCLTATHSPGFILLAVAICTFGMTVAVSLLQRAMNTQASPRYGWVFLTSVCTGATVWTTHFIGILGHQPGVSARFDATTTILSLIIAIVGAGAGLLIAAESRKRLSAVLGGGLVGLSIPTMHYTGMRGYEVAGELTWHGPFTAASIAMPVLLCILSVVSLHRWREGKSQIAPVLLFTMAVASAHFLSMAGMTIEPFANAPPFDASATDDLALAVSVVALIAIGMGVSCYLIEDRVALRFKERVFHATYRDPLTGLPNRSVLHDRIESAFQTGNWFKLLLIDIDHFKLVNDSYGQDVGDLVLVAVAERLRQVAGTEAAVFRVGGDEMGILVFENRDSALQMADDAVISLRSPYAIGDRVVTLSCSVGLCGSDRALNANEVLQFADAALHDAKRRGRNQISRYTPGMEEAEMQRMKREIELKTAIDEKQFFLAYQPVVDIGTRQPIGYEALIRWNQPGCGHVSPAEFIPLAEETGLILPLGKWVLEEACREAATWPGELHVAVNVSALQFRSPMFLSHVTQALAQSGLPAHRLEVELTETAIVSDGEQLAYVLRDLRILGVKIAMDDFGTGYSSLSHLRDLPLDRVKIDRSFVAAAAEDRNSMAVLRAVTQLGRDMGILTLGEGVETEEQFDILEKLGCDAVQGYLTGRPEPRVATAQRANAA